MTRKIRIDQIGDYTEEKMDKLLRGVILSTNAAVKKESPVDTGRFRMSWQTTEGGPQPGQLPPGDYRNSLDTETKAVNYSVGKENFGKNYCIHNNLPYAEALSRGHSPQAPAGWIDFIVQKSVKAVEKVWDNIVRED